MQIANPPCTLLQVAHICRFTKLRLFDMADDYDLILYLDADILVLGRIEAALDWFAPNGKALTPMAAARDILNYRRTFNAGVMTIQPDKALFKQMLEAGDTLEYQAGWAEQGFLYDFFEKHHGWTTLPPSCNLLTIDFWNEDKVFTRSAPRTLEQKCLDTVLADARTGPCMLARHSRQHHELQSTLWQDGAQWQRARVCMTSRPVCECD